MDTTMKRLYEAARIASNGRIGTQAALARALNTSSQRIKNWEMRGISHVGANQAQAALGISSTYVLEGAEPKVLSDVAIIPPPSDYLRLQHLDAEAGMGGARVNPDHPEIIGEQTLAREYIRQVVGFVPRPGRLVLLTGRGDSMLPTIQPGDLLIVDTGITVFDYDGLYLINLGNGQQVKRLVDRGGGLVHVCSDNRLYDPFVMPDDAVIGGKVYLRQRIERLA